MKPRLKRLNEQVIVITGASSGIGLLTARMAAEKGARVVLSARTEMTLQQLADEINQLVGAGRAVLVAGDIADREVCQRVAQCAMDNFGGFDTWVNNAGVSAYGLLESVAIEDHRKLFETNFWGTVYGSLEAIKHLKRHGGALINLGSVLSDRALPLQGMYSASKHAVKGFTEALRMELEHEKAPVSVTLVKPSAINTPYKEHAANYLEVEPKNPPPVYDPRLVAETILHCCQHRVRDVVVGGGGKFISVLGTAFPRFMDKAMEKTMFSGQQTEEPRHAAGHHGIHHRSDGFRERGKYPGHVFRHSLYTTAALHPWITRAIFTGIGLAVAIGSSSSAKKSIRRAMSLR